MVRYRGSAPTGTGTARAPAGLPETGGHLNEEDG